MGALESYLKRIENLKKDLLAEIVLQEEKGHHEYWLNDDRHHGDSFPNCWRQTNDISEAEEIKYVIDQHRMTRPAVDKREWAEKHLRSIATGPNHPGAARYAAAKTLGIKTNSGFGYYPLRIFAYRHPITATVVAGIATGGATLGLFYALAEYSSK